MVVCPDQVGIVPSMGTSSGKSVPRNVCLRVNSTSSGDDQTSYIFLNERLSAVWKIGNSMSKNSRMWFASIFYSTAYVFRIISFCFLSCILFYVACAFVICLLKYLLTYLLTLLLSSPSFGRPNNKRLHKLIPFVSHRVMCSGMLKARVNEINDF